MDLLPDRAVEAIVASVEPTSTVVGIVPISGGMSSWMTRIDVRRDDGTAHRLVLRRGRRPDDERHTLRFGVEFALLRHLDTRGIPVARPRAFDDSHRIIEQDYVVLDFVDGTSPFLLDEPRPLAERLAEVLADVHDLDAEDPGLPALPSQVDRMQGWVITDLARRPSDASLREDLVRRHLDPRWPPPPTETCLLHGDYFPGNVVWRDEDIAAVIDWESAALGDPMADVASTRLDLRWVYGEAAAEAFTERYLARTGRPTATLPIWELVVSLRPAGALSTWADDMAALGRPDITTETMRADHHAFVDDALRRLDAGCRP